MVDLNDRVWSAADPRASVGCPRDPAPIRTFAYRPEPVIPQCAKVRRFPLGALFGPMWRSSRLSCPRPHRSQVSRSPRRHRAGSSQLPAKAPARCRCAWANAAV